MIVRTKINTNLKHSIIWRAFICSIYEYGQNILCYFHSNRLSLFNICCCSDEGAATEVGFSVGCWQDTWLQSGGVPDEGWSQDEGHVEGVQVEGPDLFIYGLQTSKCFQGHFCSRIFCCSPQVWCVSISKILRSYTWIWLTEINKN